MRLLVAMRAGRVLTNVTIGADGPAIVVAVKNAVICKRPCER